MAFAEFKKIAPQEKDFRSRKNPSGLGLVKHKWLKILEKLLMFAAGLTSGMGLFPCNTTPDVEGETHGIEHHGRKGNPP